MKFSASDLLLLLSACYGLSICDALLDGIYCGRENCYDVLNITRDAHPSEVRKSYRRLAKKTHPDLFRGEEAKYEAEQRFKAIGRWFLCFTKNSSNTFSIFNLDFTFLSRLANAYEILRDKDTRKDYDYMLDNPSEYYSHYYRYYSRRMAPKVDVRLVLIVTITVISMIQYYSLWERYDSAIKYFMTVPKYRIKAQEILAEQQKLEDREHRNGKSRSKIKMSKAELREEQEIKIRQIIEEKMDIKGAYAKPKVTDVLWVQLIILPYTMAKYLHWYFSWIWRFTVLRQPYGDEQKLYLIRKFMKLGQYQFDGLEEYEKQSYLDMELWIKENFAEWKAEQEEEMKAKLAESSRHKSYRRYLKNHGPGRMTFEDWTFDLYVRFCNWKLCNLFVHYSYQTKQKFVPKWSKNKWFEYKIKANAKEMALLLNDFFFQFNHEFDYH